MVNNANNSSNNNKQKQKKPPHVNAPLFRHVMIQFYQEKI